MFSVFLVSKTKSPLTAVKYIWNSHWAMKCSWYCSKLVFKRQQISTTVFQYIYNLIFNTKPWNWMDCTESFFALTKSVDYNCGVSLSVDWELVARVWHTICYCLVKRLLKDCKSHVNNHSVRTLFQIVEGCWAIYLISQFCIYAKFVLNWM